MPVRRSPPSADASIRLGVFDGTHDAGAALSQGGRLLAAVSEERLSREKGASGWPQRSVEAVLQTAGVDPADVDVVGFAGMVNPNPLLRLARGVQASWRFDDANLWDPADWRGRLAEAAQLRSPFPRLRSDGWAARAWSPTIQARLQNSVHQQIPRLRAPLSLHDHHQSHAAAGWGTFGAEEGLVIVADGVGDGQALTVWRGRGSALWPVLAWPFPHSHGLLYATVTAMLGFRPFRHEGKVAGLSAHGDAAAVPVPWPFEGPAEARRLRPGLGPGLRLALAPLKKARREDVCAWLQRGLEADLTALIDALIQRTGLGEIALCGGVFANVRLNQAISERPGVTGLWIFPHMGDGGLAVGAALLAGGLPSPEPLSTAALGPDLPEEGLRAALSRCPERRADPSPRAIAARLAVGQLVAICAGRSEFGPRALGQRSILASPRELGVVDRLNAALVRSPFMPFAPAVAEAQLAAAIDLPANARRAAQFMTITAPATSALRATGPAAVHADGTARLQRVTADDHPLLHAILTEHHALTGELALLNTSFNLHEEPIVQGPEDALRSWRQAGLDALLLGDTLIERGA